MPDLEERVAERTATDRGQLEPNGAQQARCRQPRQDALPRRRQPRPAAAAECGAALYRHAARAGRGTELGDLAHSIEASLKAVEEIMAALLDMSRIDAGALEAGNLHRLRLRDLDCRRSRSSSSRRREKADPPARSSTAPALPPTADRTLVARIVQNLVSNAIKYTRPGGAVLVGLPAARRRGCGST